MNLTIGRVGLDIEIHPESSSEDGNVLHINGQTPFGSVADATQLRQQLRGYVDAGDEPFVPVTCTDYPEWDGYYQVTDVRIESTWAFAGVWEFSVTLLRVRQSAALKQELIHTGQPRSTAWNIIPNPGGESGTTGAEAVAAGGTAAMTNPTSGSAYEGSRVLRTTWSVASTGAGGGTRTTPFAVVPGHVVSFGVWRIVSSINNRLRAKISFFSDTAGTVLISEATSSEQQVTASTVYGYSTLGILAATVPATAVTARARVESCSGTGYQNWSVSSYLETDGWVCNYGTYVMDPAVWSASPATFRIGVPASSHSLRVKDLVSGDSTAPFVTTEAGVVKRAWVLSPSGQHSAEFYCAPADHYQGAVTLKTLANGVLRPVVGRQVPNTPGDWILGNGVFEIRPKFGTEVEFEYRGYVSGSWTSWYTIGLRSENTSTLTSAPLSIPKAMVVLYNTPERVTVRVLTTFVDPGLVGLSEVPVTVDVSLRRGDRNAALELTAGTSQRFHFLTSGWNTGTELVPFGYRTSSGSVRRQMASPQPIRVAVNPSDLSSPTGTSWSLGVGVGTASSSEWLDYMWGGSEVQNAVLL